MIITIPFKTPTINHLYGQRGFRKFLTKEAVELKRQIKELMLTTVLPGKDAPINHPIKITVEIYEDWFTQNNDIARKDISNREKFLIDCIFENLGIDDKLIFEHRLIKRQSSTEEKAIVSIENY